MVRRTWSPREKDIVSALAGKVPIIVIASLTGRTVESVRGYCLRRQIAYHYHGKTSRRAFSERETRIVGALAGKVPIQIIEILTGRGTTSIRNKAAALGKSLEYFGKGGDARLGRRRNPIEKIRKAKTMLNEGRTRAEIMEATGLASSVISNILMGMTHTEVEPQLTIKKECENIHLIGEVFR
ncbi:hypothetical protein [Vibrio phage vB_ValS_PJ32]|nr:hypothetical protein [Vibrio phage vB_ValS_PJ32]